MRKCESLAKNIENSWHVATRIHGVGIHAIDYFAIGIRGRNRRERERGGRKMEGRRKRREQISLATIMKHHLITGLVMKWNSRTILFDFCVIFRPMKGGSV